MKRILLAFALFVLPSLAWAQCNGVFPANTLCGNATGASAVPKPTPNNVLTGVPGGTNGQIEYNNSGNFGGFTMSGDCTVITTTGIITCLKTNNVAFGTAATSNTGTAGATLPFANGTNTWSGTNAFTNTATFSNGTFSALFTGGPVGILQSSPAVPLHVGDLAPASSASVILSARTRNDVTSVHGFAENSNINLGAGGLGMDSYDGRMVVSGTQNYDHLVSFQSRAQYGSSGTITNTYGFYDATAINAGTATNAYGYYAATIAGAGAVTNAYGIFIEPVTKGGTLNYAIFTNGIAPSRFGGQVQGVGGVLTGASTVAALPTCNAANEALRYYVTDQNTAVAYRGAVTGGGATRQAVLCSNNVWIQD